MSRYRGTAVLPVVRATVIGIGLVFILTAPTLTQLTSAGRLDTSDGRWSIWNIAWVARALVTNPAGALDANIFHPHTGTLAYSEMNLVPGALAVPWYVLSGGNPLAALNGSAATGLVLAFVFMWALVRRLTGSDGAGLVTATAFTFCPYVAARTPHIQLLMVFVFPLVLLAFHRHSERPGIGRGVQLGAALAIAALTCGYYGLFAGCVLGFVSLVFAQRNRAYWSGQAVAAATAAVIVIPIFLTFTEARLESGAPPGPWRPEDAERYSANAAAYLASPAAAHAWWLPSVRTWQPWSEVLFPGISLLLLAACGLVAAVREPKARLIAGTYLAVAVLAAWASFGPSGGFYNLLHDYVPGMTLLRAPARLGIVVTFGLAVAAGYGVEFLHRRYRWVPTILVLLIAAELGVRTPEWGWPSWPLRTTPPVSPAYLKLAELPRAPVVVYPFPYVSSDFHNHTRAMYWSAYHWQPLVNGYSDVIPADFREIALPINGFPDRPSFEIMRERGVRYVFWHIDTYDPPSRATLEGRIHAYAEHLRPVLQTDNEWLFEIVSYPQTGR